MNNDAFYEQVLCHYIGLEPKWSSKVEVSVACNINPWTSWSHQTECLVTRSVLTFRCKCRACYTNKHESTWVRNLLLLRKPFDIQCKWTDN